MTPSYRDDGELDLFAAQVRAHPALSVDELAKLLQQSRSDPGGTAAQRLVEHHLAVALDAALAHRNELVDFGDLYQEGTVALTVAVNEYVSRGGKAAGLRGFLTKVVDAYLESAVAAARQARQADLALVSDAEVYEQAGFALRRELGREPTPKELATRLEWSEERLENVLRAVTVAREMWDTEMLLYLDDVEE